MRIANPIYDVVFKYLLDDEKVARILLSALLGKEVLELQFRPTEVHHEAAKADGTQLLVLRLDFAAAVRMEDGSRKLVLIEIQKARSAWDVQRFRRYLGSNTDLERLLEVFDQGLASRSDPHLLDILEESFPERHREVLRRLMRAGAEQEVRDWMDVEDDMLTAFQDQAREASDLRQALVEKDQALVEKDQALVEKEQALVEKDRLIADLTRRLSGP